MNTLEELSKKIKDNYFAKGELPPIEVIKEFNSFNQDFDCLQDSFWEQTSLYFKDEFLNISDDKSEKYIYNVLILIAEFFIKGYKESICNFVKKTIVLDTRNADKKNEWVRSFEYFLLHVNPPVEIVIEAISSTIQKDYFFSLSKEAQRSIFYWWLHVVWTHKPYMNHPLWKSFQEPLQKLSDEALKQNDIATQMYIHFFAYQVLGNLYQTGKEWKTFNTAFNESESKAFTNFPVKPCKTKLTKQRKKIVFVKDRIVENAPFKVEYSLFSALLNDKNFTDNYDLFVLSMGYIDKAPDQENEVKKLRNLGAMVVAPAQIIHQEDEYYDHLQKAIILHNWFVENEIDIMVGCVNGYDIMNFLFASRSAPKQIYWSHGDFQYNVENIDKRISHFYRDNSYNYEKFHVAMLDEFHNPDEEKYKAEAKKIRERWSDDTIILGSIGRLIKMDNDEYISAVAQVLNENKNTIYLACGTGHKKSIKQKLVKHEVPMDRFFFEGFVNAHIYGYVIDIYLNTFPEPSGEALNEFLSKGYNKWVVNLKMDNQNVTEKVKRVKFHRNKNEFHYEKNQKLIYLSYDYIVNIEQVNMIMEMIKKFKNIKILMTKKPNQYEKELQNHLSFQHYDTFEFKEETYRFSDVIILNYKDHPSNFHKYILETTNALTFATYNHEQYFHEKKEIEYKRFPKALKAELVFNNDFNREPLNGYEMAYAIYGDCFQSKDDFEEYFYHKYLKYDAVIFELCTMFKKTGMLKRMRSKQKIVKNVTQVNLSKSINSFIKAITWA